ncbi:MAG: hypothetical protein WBG70_03150 [Spirulinaceae cyanobacterium]
MNPSTTLSEISMFEFVAKLQPTTAFVEVSKKILNLAKQDESVRQNINKIKDRLSADIVHPFTLTLIEDSLAKGESSDLDGGFRHLAPLLGTLYLQSSSELQFKGIPSYECLMQRLNTSESISKLNSILKRNLLADLDTYASRLYRSSTPFQKKIDTAISDLESVSLVYDRLAREFNDLTQGSNPSQAPAKCIFQGQVIPCGVFWILVIAVTLVAVIIDIID